MLVLCDSNKRQCYISDRNCDFDDFCKRYPNVMRISILYKPSTKPSAATEEKKRDKLEGEVTITWNPSEETTKARFHKYFPTINYDKGLESP